MILNETHLNLYAKNNVNVLFSGRHGVGKTEIIKKIFNANFKDNWMYFSASTMDAWTDFVGAPKVVTRSDGKEVLRLVVPENFADDNIEALFFDEFNRSSDKTRNAVMELIQFKSINGRKFNNLKVIWAAVNPFDDEQTYDVEELDPAQLDRFPVQIDIPYKLDKTYFSSKYGILHKPFVEWWSSLPKEHQYDVSPRRLEDAIKIYSIDGDLNHVLRPHLNVNDLKKRIKAISLDDEWKEVLSYNKTKKIEFFINISNVEKFKSQILNDFKEFKDYIPHDYMEAKVTSKEKDWLLAIKDQLNDMPKTFLKSLSLAININGTNESIEDYLDKALDILPKSTTKLDLKGKNVVITGTFSCNYKNYSNNRSGIESLLSNIGANVQKSVNSSTDYVISTRSDTKKASDAKSKNIPVLTETEFHAAYGDF